MLVPKPTESRIQKKVSSVDRAREERTRGVAGSEVFFFCVLIRAVRDWTWKCFVMAFALFD